MTSSKSSSATSEPQNDKPAASGGLPLFFRKPVALELKRHQKAGVMPVQNFSFAAATNSIPLNVAEFVEAAKQYPIVFTSGKKPMPVAVVGLEKKNYFIDAEGSWKEGSYLPAYVRKYPFVFTEIKERSRFVLCIDEESEQFKEKGAKGALNFYDDGKPSELTRNALEFCTAFHNHYQLTNQFIEAIAKADLLTPMQSTSKLFSGREIKLGGFQMIDEKKLAELPDATLLEFRKKGWLPYIYFAILSGTNWKSLVELAAKVEKKSGSKA